MTYVNHILQEKGWDKICDVGEVFPGFAWRLGGEHFLPNPDAFNWRTRFALPNHQGRLYTKIDTAKRDEDDHPILRFELTVRGIGTDKSLEGMRAWFDIAHEWIVRGFADLTTSHVRENIWRQIR